MSLKKKKSLVLFLTDNMSLGGWDDRGILERELALYRYLGNQGLNVRCVSYGDSLESRYLGLLGSIKLIHNKFGFKKMLYKTLLPVLSFRDFAKADFFKTNQIKGARYAVQLKKIFRKKLIVRFGDLSSVTAKERGLSLSEINKVRREEDYAFRNADRIIAPTNEFKSFVAKNYSVKEDVITVVPNYVDLEVFKPSKVLEKRSSITICSVAKDKPTQKNIASLIQALQGVSNVKLILIGTVCKDPSIKKLSLDLGVKTEFLGVVSNKSISGYLRSSDLYVQPSLYEGHPKSILEAMACGLPVIASDVPGINNLISHRETGFLCGTDSASIRQAINDVVADPELRRNMGSNARQYIVNTCSLEAAAAKEINVYSEIMR